MSLQKSKTGLPIAGDGFRFFVPPVLLGIGIAVSDIWLDKFLLHETGLLLVVVGLFIAWFFRDPERVTPKIDGGVVSPADGTVTNIALINHPEFEGGKAKRISIHLSLFDVHVNRAPIKGSIGKVEYHPGKLISGPKDKSSDENEHNIIEFINEGEKVFVKQIAGLLARRIVCGCEPGEAICQSDRIGLIRFGSRVDTILPVDAEVRVKKGMSVKGGESILAILPNVNTQNYPHLEEAETEDEIDFVTA